MSGVLGERDAAVREINLTDPNPPRDRRHDAEQIKLLVTSGTKQDWGDLEPLRGTTWAAGVELVPAEALDHALHGYILPLQQALGRSPRYSGRRVSEAEGACGTQDICPTYVEGLCCPGGVSKDKKPGPPECYDAPVDEAHGAEVRDLFNRVAQAWREDRHTVVVVGERFSLK